jgi:hypothetical protein
MLSFPVCSSSTSETASQTFSTEYALRPLLPPTLLTLIVCQQVFALFFVTVLPAIIISQVEPTFIMGVGCSRLPSTIPTTPDLIIDSFAAPNFHS